MLRCVGRARWWQRVGRRWQRVGRRWQRVGDWDALIVSTGTEVLGRWTVLLRLGLWYWDCGRVGGDRGTGTVDCVTETGTVSITGTVVGLGLWWD